MAGLGDMFGASLATVNGQKPRNSDRIQAGQPLNLRAAFEAAQNIPVAGDALSGGMALYDAAKGDYGSAAMNALGVLPFVSGTMVNHGKLFRGLGKKFDPAVKNPVEWFSETPELANIYGKNIVTKEPAKSIDVADLGFRDYMTEVKQDNVLDRVKRAVVENFQAGKIDKNKAMSLNDKIEDMRGASNEYKRAHEFINTPEISSILKDSGYDAISHVENGHQTFGFLNGVDRNTSKLTEFEQRHLTAQRNAALPIEQGGLGLPVNNTYTDRKEAMRSLDIVHGSPNPNVEQFDAALAGKNSGNSQGDAVWGSSNPANSNGYALNWNSYKTSPEYLAIQEERNGLLPKIADAFSSDKAEFSRLRDGLDEIGKRESSLYNKFMDYGLGSEGSTLYPLTIIGGKDFPVVDAAGANYMKVNQGAIDGARLSGADGAIIKNVQDNAGTFSGTADSVATFNPARIRSRFAAFDPMRRHEADLLGNINPQLAGAMGVTGLGAAYGATQLPDEYKSAIANAFKGQQ